VDTAADGGASTAKLQRPITEGWTSGSCNEPEH